MIWFRRLINQRQMESELKREMTITANARWPATGRRP